MKSKWHNITIRSKSFEDLHKIQKQIPIRASIPQVIEWLIKVGEKQIKQSGTNYEKTEM
jgi:hypothetical protein|tara:strand:+ start:535 stop:711 length:177 start_codon:yes stop_codon:yes gene_type:complete